MATNRKPTQRKQELQRQNDELQLRLSEAEETLRAIREGEVDAVVVSGSKGEQIFSLVGTDSVYRLIVETMKEAAFTVTFDGKILFCNAQFGQLVKRPLELIVGHPLDEFVAENERASVSSLLVAAQQEPVKQRLVFQDLNSTGVPAYVSANVLNQPDGLSICVVANDLTELENSTELIQQLRRQQESLRQSEERLALAASATQVGMFDWDMAKGTVLWTQAHDAIFGYAPTATTTTTTTTTTEHDYRRWTDRVHPEDLPRVEEEMRRCREVRKPLEVQYRIIWPDGSLHWVETKGVFLYNSSGKAERMLGVVMDITESKRGEEALAAAHRQVQGIIDNTPAIVYVFDLEERFLLANAAVAELFHSTPEQMIGKRRHEFMPKADADWHEANDRKVIEAGRAMEFEEASQLPDRSITWLTTKFPLRDAQGTIYAVAGISADVSDRKRAEEALRESESRFHSLFNNSPDAIFLAIPSGPVTHANPAACAVFGMTEEELCRAGRKGIEDPTDPRHQAAVAERARSGRVSYEATHMRKDGSKFPSEVSSVIVEDGNQSIVILRDITARKVTEEALQASLQEKEVLLKEIHHRVKNNMQVISSLISLQADTLENQALRGVFDDLRDRVRTMALVHEKLYQSENLAHVDFAEYARSLLNYLWHAHGDKASDVRLTLDLPSVTFPVQTAVPCGLILNELTTNALKHAFRDRTDGELTVALNADPDGNMCLVVSDNGVGFPAGFDWRQTRSLGLQLVRMLVGQLGGTLDVRTDGGTTFQITFKPTRPEEKHG